MQRRIGILSVLVAAWVAVPAGASTFVAMDQSELIAASSAVVRGSVVSVDSFWNDAHTLIVSEAVLEVEDTLVGEAPRYLTVRTAGGTVDDVTVEAHGFPNFHEGDRVLLFLQRDDVKPLGWVDGRGRPEAYRVTGYQLGYYRIFTDRAGEDVAVPTADGGTRLLTRDGREVAAPKARRLDAFEAELRQLGAQRGAER